MHLTNWYWDIWDKTRRTGKRIVSRITSPQAYSKPKRAKNKKKLGTPSQRKQARRKRSKSKRLEGFQITAEEPMSWHHINRLRRKKQIAYFAKGGKV